jgi:hypothetical protein
MEALLGHGEPFNIRGAGSFLERPLVAIDTEETAGWEAAGSIHGPGTVIGPYKLLE